MKCVRVLGILFVSCLMVAQASATPTLANTSGPVSFGADFELSQVPEPASMLLIGGGSLLLGLRGRRKTAKKA